MAMKFHITPAMRELRATISEAEQISAKAEMTKRDEARVNVLLAKIAALRANAVAPDDFSRRWLCDFIKGRTPEKRTDMVEGTQTLTVSEGALGGYLVPTEIHNEIIYGMAQFDPLLDENVVTLVQSKNFSLRPFRVPGWDLSTFTAVKVGEGQQQARQTPPALSGSILNSYTYRASLSASFEFEKDDFQPTMDQMEVAFSVAMARGIGADLVTGNGTTAPQGLLTGAANSNVTVTSAGKLLLPDFESIYFSVDRIYRQSPKCAWVMNDTVYQQARQAVDNAGRPLLSIKKDEEEIMGKRVLVSPSMPSTAGSKGIVFGDLSHLVVRCSRLILTRNLEASNFVEYGLGLYTALMRADAVVFDPTSGVKPAICYATLHA
jgi:HK97 family phage major capsid protein